MVVSTEASEEEQNLVLELCSVLSAYKPLPGNKNLLKFTDQNSPAMHLKRKHIWGVAIKVSFIKEKYA